MDVASRPCHDPAMEASSPSSPRHRSILPAAGFVGAIAAVALWGLVARPASQPNAEEEWLAYGGSAAGDRFSRLTQITPANVAKLREAWRVETGAGGLQTTPLMVDGRLYVISPKQEVMALDPTTGRKIWMFSPPDAGMQPVRGLSLWRNRGEKRLFTSYGTFLAALNPATGRPIPSFGKHGRIDLRENLGRDPTQMATFMTSPGAIYDDLIITGFRTSENRPAAPGAIRAYDVRSGRLRWSFNSIPRPGEPGSETWSARALAQAGGGNSWPAMVVDTERGIVFAPTGSAVDDFYGGDRKGYNLYANSLLALDAKTGKRLWHFQGVHHDIWDRDFPTPPVLLTVRRDGKTVDAVAQGSKQGFIFLFDRSTGKPLFPIEERAVATSSLPGEITAPTQPFPLLPAPVTRQQVTEDMLTTRTSAAHAAALAEFRTSASGPPYTPFRLDRQTILAPGYDGGMEWGGSAVDPRSGVMYVNANDIAATGGLTEAPPPVPGGNGAQLYQQNCAMCHGIDRKGSPPDFPSLVDIGSRLIDYEADKIIVGGRGRMPGFPQLSKADRRAIIAHLFGPPVRAGVDREVRAPAGASVKASRYSFTGYRKFLDPDGYPAVKPPWGTLSAIDMNSGRYLWKVPLGQYPALVAAGMPNTGSENYGGPIVTSTGLLFIGATVYDRKFRAFSAADGMLLWEAALPYAGVATPMTYKAKGRQYIVIATSGQRDPKGPQGSAYIAFALPE